MDKEEFIEELGIEGKQSYSDDGSLVVTLTEESWAKAQVILDNSDINQGLEEDQESSTISYEASNLQYLNDYYIVNLIADFQATEYKLIIKDR